MRLMSDPDHQQIKWDVEKTDVDVSMWEEAEEPIN